MVIAILYKTPNVSKMAPHFDEFWLRWGHSHPLPKPPTPTLLQSDAAFTAFTWRGWWSSWSWPSYGQTRQESFVLFGKIISNCNVKREKKICSGVISNCIFSRWCTQAPARNHTKNNKTFNKGYTYLTLRDVFINPPPELADDDLCSSRVVGSWLMERKYTPS